jgi:hypothetical protein
MYPRGDVAPARSRPNPAVIWTTPMSESEIHHTPTDQGQAPAFAPSSPAEQRAADDIQRVLTDFQLGLESLRALHAQRTELQASLLEREAELARRAEELRASASDSDSLRAALAQRDADLDSLRAALAQRDADLESLRTTLQTQADEHRAAVESLSARVESLTREAQEGPQAMRDQLATAQQALADKTAEAADLEKVLQALQQRFRAEIDARKLADDRAARADQTISGAEARITELTARLASAQAEAQALRDAAPRQAPARSDDALARRRARLKAYRAALRRHSLRVKKGADALAKRFEQVELATRQRTELAAIRDRVIAADRALQRARARGRAATTVLAIVGTVAILAALSWAVAREVAPATFVAESTLKADGRGRDLNDAELEEWLRFHQDTLADPRFHQAAAERFARVGRADLGAASAVADMVSARVQSDSIVPGELKLSLQATGKDNARRTLETFTAALASFANAAQQRRIDGGSTVVPAPAAADDRPIDNTQTFYALGMLAAGLAGVSVLGLGIWRKLSSAKSAFEQDAQLAAVLDEARWAQATRG